MKKVIVILLILILLAGAGLFGFYKINMAPVSKTDKTEVKVTIEPGTSINKIGTILQENQLIRSSDFFKIYTKVKKINDIKAATYFLNRSMSFEEIIKTLQENSTYEQISITFKEGINYREFAEVVAKNTKNSKEDVFKVLEDSEYINSLIKKYWFLTDDIKNKKIYYSLEGYLFPETYYFSPDVDAKGVIEKLLDEMEKVLNPYKAKIEKSKYSIHELLTLASMAEKEVDNLDDRSKVVRVFMNRLNRGLNLGSDITTRYGLKIDDKRALTADEYASYNDYNTRNAKFVGLPVSPICMLSKSSIEAAINPNENNYLYFISDIKTKKTYFYENYNDFINKKNELASTNNGY